MELSEPGKADNDQVFPEHEREASIFAASKE